jgi:tetratricopeptide (TPR) repeat protein
MPVNIQRPSGLTRTRSVFLDGFPSRRKDRVTTLSDIGYSWFEKGDHDEARRSYEAALHMDPNYVAVLQGLGDVWFETGLYEETIAYYYRVLTLSPQDRNSYY